MAFCATGYGLALHNCSLLHFRWALFVWGFLFQFHHLPPNAKRTWLELNHHGSVCTIYKFTFRVMLSLPFLPKQTTTTTARTGCKYLICYSCNVACPCEGISPKIDNCLRARIPLSSWFHRRHSELISSEAESVCIRNLFHFFSARQRPEMVLQRSPFEFVMNEGEDEVRDAERWFFNERCQ